jgi:hypothetical protein
MKLHTEIHKLDPEALCTRRTTADDYAKDTSTIQPSCCSVCISLPSVVARGQRLSTAWVSCVFTLTVDSC